MQVDKEQLEVVARRGIVVWMYSLRQVRNLRRFGSVIYISKKMKYAIVYVSEAEVEVICPKIEHLHFVRSIDLSYRPDIEMNFADKIGNKQVNQSADDGFDIEEKATKIRLADHVFNG